MTMFVHLAFESTVARILRSGLTRLRRLADGGCGVFAMPVVANHFVTHQWLRELRRRGSGPMAGVCFRIPDDEPVQMGRYNEPHVWMSADESAARIAGAADPLGLEVVIPRKIRPKEIVRVRRLRQVIGWRYKPGAHASRPCPCSYCQRGEFKGRSIRERLQ